MGGGAAWRWDGHTGSLRGVLKMSLTTVQITGKVSEWRSGGQGGGMESPAATLILDVRFLPFFFTCTGEHAVEARQGILGNHSSRSDRKLSAYRRL